MDRETLAVLLKEMDLHVARSQSEIRRLKLQIANLESARAVADMQAAIDELEKALALYAEYRQKLADEEKS